MEKYLGKIVKAEFGVIPDYPFLMGVQFEFSFDNGCRIGDGGKYTVNMSPNCKWESQEVKYTYICESLEKLYMILKMAKVDYVSKLVNKPVEITLDRNCFSDFRILTEVL